MLPPEKKKTDFERIPVYDEWVNGEIVEIQYDENHKSIYQGQTRVKPAVRFSLRLDGCRFNHKTRWMTFNYSEKAYLYKTFLKELVEGATEYMRFDLDALKGMKIKTMWQADGDYDNLMAVRPLEARLPLSAGLVEGEPPEEEVEVLAD